MVAISFEEYLEHLAQLSTIVDPTLATPESQEIRDAGAAIDALEEVTVDSLADLIREHPEWVRSLGLAVGLSLEKLKNGLRKHTGSSGWVTNARTNPVQLIEILDAEYYLIELLRKQRNTTYSFSDILVARAGTRRSAQGAVDAGQLLEDALEAVAVDLGLEYELQTRFEGRSGATAPCDLAIPAGGNAAQIVVAAKAFDSTGSKLTAAMKEVEDMANVRKPTQFVMAAIDGIGWLGRQADLRRIHSLWTDGTIDGMYTVATLRQFRSDLSEAASLRGLSPTN